MLHPWLKRPPRGDRIDRGFENGVYREQAPGKFPYGIWAALPSIRMRKFVGPFHKKAVKNEDDDSLKKKVEKG